MVSYFPTIVLIVFKNMTESLIVCKLIYMVEIILEYDWIKFMPFFFCECRHVLTPSLCVTQMLEEQAEKQKCLWHYQQFHKLVYTLSKCFLKE